MSRRVVRSISRTEDAGTGFTRRRAAVLVLTLWLVVALTLMASSLGFDVQVNSKLAMLQRNRFVAYNLAKSAIAVGMTHLQNDLLIDYAENPNQPFDAPSDVWAQPDRKEKDVEVELGRGTYELEITDEDSKININIANQRVLKAMLEYYGYEAPDSDEIANAIVDWRDPDDMTLGAAGEKENEHYSELAGQKIRINTAPEDLIYQSRNEAFLTIEELLDVIGITPDLYYGYDPDTEEAREQKRRDDIALGKHSRERKRKENKTLPLKDIVTVRGSGRINVNTASQEVLTILLYAAGNCTDLNSAETAAKSVCDFRGGPGGRRTPDPDDAFRSLADLAKVPGLNQQNVGQLSSSGTFGVQLSFNSNTFKVTGIGRAGRVKRTVHAIVQRSLDTYNPDDMRLLSNKGKFGRGLRGGFASRRGMRRRRRGGEVDDNLIRIPAIRVVQWIE
jgi:type II secretory pathway component PulK